MDKHTKETQGKTPDAMTGPSQAESMAHPLSRHGEFVLPVSTTFNKNDTPPATKGEKIFNALDWYGIGWIVNAAIGTTMANKLSFGSWQPGFNKFNENLATKWFTKEAFEVMGGGEGAKAIEAARGITQLAALMSGGYAVMLPIKIIHDYKKPLVLGLDKMFGPSHPTDSQQKLIEARHAYLDHEPHISLWNAFQGRTSSMAVILGVHYAIGQPSIAKMINPQTSFTGFEKYLGTLGEGSYNMLRATNAGSRWLDATEKHLGAETERLTKAFEGKTDAGFTPTPAPEHTKKLLALGYEDILYSLGGATGTMIFSKLFAHRSHEAADAPAPKIQHAQYEQRLQQPTQQVLH